MAVVVVLLSPQTAVAINQDGDDRDKTPKTKATAAQRESVSQSDIMENLERGEKRDIASRIVTAVVIRFRRGRLLFRRIPPEQHVVQLVRQGRKSVVILRLFTINRRLVG